MNRLKRLLILTVFIVQNIHVQAEILTPVQWSIHPSQVSGNTFDLVFTAKIDDGWHLYDTDLPKNGPVPTSFHFETQQGVTLNGNAASTTKPTQIMDKTFEMELRWFAKKAVFIQKFNVTHSKTFHLSGYVEYMACNDVNCLPPTRENFEFTTNDLKDLSKESISSSPPPRARNLIPPVNDATTTTPPLKNRPNVASATDPFEQNPLWHPATDKLQSYEAKSGNSVNEKTSGWWLFFSGFLGGILALLTPCVWPIIPMTVSFFLKRNKNRKKAIREAVYYGLSIVLIYLTLGIGITLLFGASALNSLSTNAVFNLFLFALLVLFAVSFFGAFDLMLPSAWTNKADRKADSSAGFTGIFFMAFTLALVSFSCTGPIVGTLLVQAASTRFLAGPAIGMLGFALALALPFGFFAVFPNLLQNLPKSGGWLNTVKVVLGFLELALSLKFFSVADLAYGWGLLDREVFLVLWIVLFGMLGFYLLGKLRLPHDSAAEHVSIIRLFLAISSFAFTVYLIPGLWGAPLKAVSAFAPPAGTQDFNLYKNEVQAAFNDYNTGMEQAKRNGKPVVVDFSGYGCVNCRKMESAVWQNPYVKNLLENEYILITLMVDNKKPLPHPIEVTETGKKRLLKTLGDQWSYLQRRRFGANAQPFYILLNNNGEPIGPSYGYEKDPKKFVSFLKKGLEEFRNQTKTAH